MATVGQPDAMRRITVHYVNPPIAGAGEVSAADGLDDDQVLDYVIGDVLQGQEGLYQSILYGSHYYHGENSSGGEATTSTASEIDQQIAYDLVYARQLQGLENLTIDTPADEDDDISCVPSPSDSETDEPSEGNNEEEVAVQDDNDDPDNMTYEQRQALVESVGNEDRGLSDLLISYLETWKYKSGFFPRKANHDERRETVITLACKHTYHEACVARWLKIDRTCPVCKYEVFGPS
uniref:RING-type domain-containing protein n=1 Tax=Oryza brachyantha TaxID=4533 RepID=J3MAV7_ORYBR